MKPEADVIMSTFDIHEMEAAATCAEVRTQYVKLYSSHLRSSLTLHSRALSSCRRVVCNLTVPIIGLERVA